MNIFKKILEGVEYIHSRDIMHRDLKVCVLILLVCITWVCSPHISSTCLAWNCICISLHGRRPSVLIADIGQVWHNNLQSRSDFCKATDNLSPEVVSLLMSET